MPTPRQKRRIETILQQVYQGSGAGPTLVGVSYERVSHKKSIGGTSLETQPLDIERWAGDHHVRIVGHYVDRGRSGTTDNRPGFRQMLADLERLGVSVILVWKLDRFARSAALQYQKIEEFTERGVALVSITEMIDYSTAMGKQALGFASVGAQAYSDQLSERMIRALRHTAESGFWVGPVPLGYARQGRRQPLCTTEDAATIRELFARYATERYSDTSLAAAMNAEGYSGRDRAGNPMPLTREGVRTILKNRAYIGKVTSGDQEYDGSHPPLISLEVFQHCQDIRARRTTENIQVRHPDKGVLQGIAYCATCGGFLWQHACCSKGHLYRYYRCSGINNTRCDEAMSRADAIDPQALALFDGLALPDRLIERVLKRLRQSDPAPVPSTPSAEHIQEQRERLKKLYVRGHVSDEEYEAQYAALGDVPAPAPPQPTVNYERALGFLRDLPQLLREAARAEQQRVLGIVFARVWIVGHTIAALTPHQVYQTLLQAMSAAGCEVGVADGRQPRLPHIYTLPYWPVTYHQNSPAYAR